MTLLSTIWSISAQCDYGDATGYGDPEHLATETLKLGSLIDGENGSQPTAAADGDDLNGTDDEDGVTIPVLTQGIASKYNSQCHPGLCQ